MIGEHAPGLKCPVTDTFLMAHHVMMAHGKAVQAMRGFEAANSNRLRSYRKYGISCIQSEEDIEAAKKVLFACPEDKRVGLERILVE